jgi:hypothetical protein
VGESNPVGGETAKMAAEMVAGKEEIAEQVRVIRISSSRPA